MKKFKAIVRVFRDYIVEGIAEADNVKCAAYRAAMRMGIKGVESGKKIIRMDVED